MTTHNFKAGDKIYKVYRGEVDSVLVIDKVTPTLLIIGHERFKVDNNGYISKFGGSSDYGMFSYKIETPELLRSAKRVDALKFVKSRNIDYYDTDSILAIQEIIKNAKPHR